MTRILLALVISLSCSLSQAAKKSNCIDEIAKFYNTQKGSYITAKCLNEYELTTDKLNVLGQLSKRTSNKAALLKILSQTPAGYEEKVNTIVSKMSLKSLKGEARNYLINEKAKLYNLQSKYDSVLAITRNLQGGSEVDDSIYYLRSVAHLNKKQVKSALKYMQKAESIFRLKDKNKLSDEDLKFGDILYSSLGKLLNAGGRYSAAEKAYKKVRATSPIWPEGLTEVSWTYLSLNKESKALGNAFYVQKSTSERAWKPSLLLSQSISFLKLCHYPEAKKSVDIINNHYKSIHEIIKNKQGNQLYNHFVNSINKSPKKLYKGYPTEVLRYLGVQPDALRMQNTINNYISEIEAIEALKKQFKKNKSAASKLAYKQYSQTTRPRIVSLDSRIDAIKALSNKYFKYRFANLKTELKSILNQAELVEFEVLSRSSDEIRIRSLGKKIKEKRINPFKLYGKSQLSWGYLGENWKDEKGGVQAAIKSRCEIKPIR